MHLRLSKSTTTADSINHWPLIKIATRQTRRVNPGFRTNYLFQKSAVYLLPAATTRLVKMTTNPTAAHNTTWCIALCPEELPNTYNTESSDACSCDDKQAECNCYRNRLNCMTGITVSAQRLPLSRLGLINSSDCRSQLMHATHYMLLFQQNCPHMQLKFRYHMQTSMAGQQRTADSATQMGSLRVGLITK